MNCPVHGRQELLEICNHINPIKDYSELKGSKSIPFFGTKVCKRCYETYNIKEIEEFIMLNKVEKIEDIGIDLEKALIKIYDKINKKAICSKCINL